ncbi:MAG TPA: IPT/TIG domain-containing protein, partial [Mycobacterium sp.]|uniref:IPT/TIG domain-containing protein n=1 Tax=Mycobacterium sp. TaxID=1785 RepID=UPI002D3BC30D
MRTRLSSVLAIAAGAMVLVAPTLPAYGDSGSGTSSTIGIVPPNDPGYFCNPQLRQAIDTIDYCRAVEGVGPMVLPDNYGSLPPQAQMLVVFNLERINRGLPPIVGLSQSLDGYAQQGADANDDPPFPPDGNGGGGIWDANTSTLGADDAFMYTDDCSPHNVVGCWGHRDNILIDDNSTDPLDGGGGFTLRGYNSQLNSYTFEFIYGYPHDDLVFTWQDELSHFASPPAVERVQPPTITAIRPSLASTAGGTTFDVRGTNLISTKAIQVGGVRATHVRCETETSCTARAPAHAAGAAEVRATTVAGTSPLSRHMQLTYAKPALKRIGSARRSV